MNDECCAGCGRPPANPGDRMRWNHIVVSVHDPSGVSTTIVVPVCLPPCAGPAMRMIADEFEKAATPAAKG